MTLIFAYAWAVTIACRGSEAMVIGHWQLMTLPVPESTTQTTSSSAGLRWMLLMLQHWAHSRNRPTATVEKTRKVFSILVVIFLVGTISGKSLNCCHQMPYFKAKMHQIRFRLRLCLRPRCGNLQQSSRPLSWI